MAGHCLVCVRRLGGAWRCDGGGRMTPVVVSSSSLRLPAAALPTAAATVLCANRRLARARRVRDDMAACVRRDGRRWAACVLLLALAGCTRTITPTFLLYTTDDRCHLLSLSLP